MYCRARVLHRHLCFSTYTIEENVGEWSAQVLALHEGEPVDQEHGVVAVEHVDRGVLVHEAQVARAVRLPGHLVGARRFREQIVVRAVQRHRLPAGKAATAFPHIRKHVYS